jgi:hypothetical protein
MPILIIGINNILKLLLYEGAFYGYFPLMQTSITKCLIDHAFTLAKSGSKAPTFKCEYIDRNQKPCWIVMKTMNLFTFYFFDILKLC